MWLAVESYAHRLVAVGIDAAEFEVPLQIARLPHRMIGGTSDRP